MAQPTIINVVENGAVVFSSEYPALVFQFIEQQLGIKIRHKADAYKRKERILWIERSEEREET